ncbi:MAG TPA: CocE/NonD family hydrolase [Jatrophihabitans sp.]
MTEAGPIQDAVKSEERDGMRIDWDVPITMGDGAVLRADIYRPVGSGRYPVIASHGPYAKGLTFEAGYPRQWERLQRDYPDALDGSSGKYAAWELVDPEQWIPHGYSAVRIDSRGAGRSPGFIDVWGPQEARDFYECIEWIAAQPWSNGRVGLAGISYYAKNQWQVAALRPPHLSAICPWEGANDYYREMTHHGGIHNAFLPDWYRRMSTIQHGLGSRGFRNPESGLLASGDTDLSDDELSANRSDLADEIIAHPFDDDWHAEHSSRPEDITTPVLSAANWGGLGNHQRGNFTAWQKAGSEQKWLEVHGGTHWAGFYTEYGRDLQRRFFDHFLLDKGDWLTQPPVSLNIRHVDGSYRLRAEQEWPLARTRWLRHYFDLSNAGLAETAPTSVNQLSYRATGDGITLSTPPLSSPAEITGPLSARLWISSSTEDADLFLVLRAFDPDDNEVLFQGANDPRTPLSQGWLRVSHRAVTPELSEPWAPWHPHQSSEPLVPGQVYEVEVEIWPTCVLLPAGYRLALSILGRDFDHGLAPSEIGGAPMRGSGPFRHDHPEDRPASIFDNEVSVYAGGDMPSSILLPVIDPNG